MADEVKETTQEVIKPASTPAPVQVTEPVELWEDGKPFDAKRAKELLGKYRDEIKELKPKAKKADELEAAERTRKEAEMSELEKANVKLAEQEAKLKELTLSETRRKVGTKFALPEEIYSLLPDMPEEEMAVKAEALAKAIPKPTLNPNNPGPESNAKGTPQQWHDFLNNNGPLPK